MIFAVVKRYETDDADFADWHYKTSEYDKIYEKMMCLTGNDHEVSASAASWCEVAYAGETYEFDEGEIEMQEID